MKDDYDVAIIGAGPGGSSSAIRLARAGLRVLLVEKARFPRQKLCGEFVSPECVEHFDDLGVLADIKMIGGSDIRETVFYSRSGRATRIENDWFAAGGQALGVSRAELDLVLLNRARTAGATILSGTRFIGGASSECGLVDIRVRTVDRVETSYTAKIAIDATGRDRSLVRCFQQQGKTKRAEHVAFKAHIANATLSPGVCEIYSYQGGYGGCNAIEGGLFNVCFITAASAVRFYENDPAKIFENVVLQNRRALRTLDGAIIEGSWLSVPVANYGRSDLKPAPGVLAIGDAASFIDPFTGSGILMALESSRLVSDAIVAVKTSDVLAIAAKYQSEYETKFRSRLRLSSVLRRAAFHPGVGEFAVRLLSTSQGFRRAIAAGTRR